MSHILSRVIISIGSCFDTNTLTVLCPLKCLIIFISYFMAYLFRKKRVARRAVIHKSVPRQPRRVVCLSWGALGNKQGKKLRSLWPVPKCCLSVECLAQSVWFRSRGQVTNHPCSNQRWHLKITHYQRTLQVMDMRLIAVCIFFLAAHVAHSCSMAVNRESAGQYLGQFHYR